MHEAILTNKVKGCAGQHHSGREYEFIKKRSKQHEKNTIQNTNTRPSSKSV